MLEKWVDLHSHFLCAGRHMWTWTLQKKLLGKESLKLGYSLALTRSYESRRAQENVHAEISPFPFMNSPPHSSHGGIYLLTVKYFRVVATYIFWNFEIKGFFLILRAISWISSTFQMIQSRCVLLSDNLV